MLCGHQAVRQITALAAVNAKIELRRVTRKTRAADRKLVLHRLPERP
jgi:hypothetical protein